MLLLLPFLFEVSLQLFLPHCIWCKVSIVQLAQLILQVLLIPLLSLICGLESLSRVCLGLFLGDCLEECRPYCSQWVLLYELLGLEKVVLLRFVQEMVHVEGQGESHPVIEFLPIEGLHVEGESLQLQGQNLGQPLQPRSFGGRNFFATARALIGICTLQYFGTQVFEESLLYGIVVAILLWFEFVFHGKL